MPVLGRSGYVSKIQTTVNACCGLHGTDSAFAATALRPFVVNGEYDHSSASCNLLMISKRHPENTPEYSDFLYLYGIQWITGVANERVGYVSSTSFFSPSTSVILAICLCLHSCKLYMSNHTDVWHPASQCTAAN